MRDISALTPPLLMCAVILVAIGAFLRHEMNRKRPEDVDHSRGIPGVPPISGQSPPANNQESSDSSSHDDEE